MIIKGKRAFRTRKYKTIHDKIIDNIPLYAKGVFSIIGAVIFSVAMMYIFYHSAIIYLEAYASGTEITPINKIDLLDFYAKHFNLMITIVVVISFAFALYIFGWLLCFVGINDFNPWQRLIGFICIFIINLAFLLLLNQYKYVIYAISVIVAALLLTALSREDKNKINCVKNKRISSSKKLSAYFFISCSFIYISFLFFINILAFTAYFSNQYGHDDGAKQRIYLKKESNKPELFE